MRQDDGVILTVNEKNVSKGSLSAVLREGKLYMYSEACELGLKILVLLYKNVSVNLPFPPFPYYVMSLCVFPVFFQ